MKINKVKCKTALSTSTLPGLDYSLNPYRGCQHNCTYCYVPNVLKINRKEWGTFVDIKTNIPVILSKELHKKKPGTIGISTITDPYQPVEKKYQLTRYCLEQILTHDYPVCIQTKSKLILRDINLISKFSDVEVMVSIGTLNENDRKILEPFSSPVDERLNILKKFSEIGVKTSVFFGPIYPTIKTSDLSNIVDVFIEHGATEIMIDKFNLKTGIKENIETTLQKKPELLETFKKNIFNNNLIYYNKIKETMKQLNKNIKITEAF